MDQQATVDMTGRKRKALMVERGISVASIAKESGSSSQNVSRIINHGAEFDTPMTKRVKALVADKLQLSVSELWPEADVSGNAPQESGNGGGPPRAGGRTTGEEA